MTPGIPLSLYVHIPWCIQKCPYCDFNSHAINNDMDEQAYVQQLFRNLESQLPWVWGRTTDSIFIGGGTPSLFSGDAINELISGIRARLMLKADPEITIETNPGTADIANYKAYREAGINRISIGVQSLNSKHLKALGRIHDAKQAKLAVAMAKQAGFERINCDLMFGLGGQTVAQAMDDLKQVIELQPEHISWYQLTIEPNTAYFNKPPNNIPSDDHIAEIQDQGRALLNQAGYQQYEISAWSQPGGECKHNLNYWQFGDYLGIGAGAHGKISDFNDNSIRRIRNKKQPHHWLQPDSELIAERSAIASDDLALEFFMNVLRLNGGVDLGLLFERTGLLPAQINNKITQAQKLGLMHLESNRYQATEKGLNFLNDLIALFMDDSEHIILQTEV